jgi:hypothetical protein
MRLHRVFVPMTDEERAALVSAAQQSMRDPQQHERFILRSVLLNGYNEPSGKNNRQDAQPSTAGILAVQA